MIIERLPVRSQASEYAVIQFQLQYVRILGAAEYIRHIQCIKAHTYGGTRLAISVMRKIIVAAVALRCVYRSRSAVNIHLVVYYIVPYRVCCCDIAVVVEIISDCGYRAVPQIGAYRMPCSRRLFIVRSVILRVIAVTHVVISVRLHAAFFYPVAYYIYVSLPAYIEIVISVVRIDPFVSEIRRLHRFRKRRIVLVKIVQSKKRFFAELMRRHDVVTVFAVHIARCFIPGNTGFDHTTEIIHVVIPYMSGFRLIDNAGLSQHYKSIEVSVDTSAVPVRSGTRKSRRHYSVDVTRRTLFKLARLFAELRIVRIHRYKIGYRAYFFVYKPFTPRFVYPSPSAVSVADKSVIVYRRQYRSGVLGSIIQYFALTYGDTVEIIERIRKIEQIVYVIERVCHILSDRLFPITVVKSYVGLCHARQSVRNIRERL